MIPANCFVVVVLVVSLVSCTNVFYTLTPIHSVRSVSDPDNTTSQQRVVISNSGGGANTENHLGCGDLHKDSTNVSYIYGNICNFTKQVDDCSIDEGFINYTQTVYCSFSSLIWLGIIVLLIWWLFLFVGLAVTADDFFCPSLTVITKTLHLSHNIAGVTLLAFGNGAPDIFSAIAAIGNAKDGDAGLAIGALVGAGIFVTTIVVGAITITHPFHAMERPFLRDIIFYIAAVFWTFYVLHDKKIVTGEAIGFIGLYVFYVIVVMVSRYIRQKNKAKEEALAASNKAKEDFTQSDDGIPHVLVSNDIPVSDSEGIDAGLREAHRSTPQPNRAIAGLALTAEKVIVSPLLGNEVNTVPELHPQITNSAILSKNDNELTPLLKSFKSSEDNTVLTEFFKAINPVDVDEWKNMKFYSKLYEIFKAPILFLLMITIPVVDYEKEKHNWNKILNVLQCMTCPLFSAIVTKGIFAGDDDFNLKTLNGFPVIVLIVLISIVLSGIVWCTSKHDTQPKYHDLFAYMGFVISVIWIYSIANEIVNLLQMLGIVFHISNAILGLTLLAWGNSIGDLIADTVMARQGFPRMGISACFGGPLFNLLLGIGIPFTIGCIRKGGTFHIQFTGIQVILTLFLTLSLLSSLILAPLLKFHLNKKYGLYLIVLYVIFIIFAVLVESGVLNIDVKSL